MSEKKKFYITTAIAYASFGGSGSVIGSGAVLLYCLIGTAISVILYLTGKP